VVGGLISATTVACTFTPVYLSEHLSVRGEIWCDPTKKTSTHASYRNSETGRASTDAVLRDDHRSKILNQTQPNPWVDPAYGHLWDDC